MASWKSEFNAYVREILNAGVNPVGIRSEIRELAYLLLSDEGLYIDKVWFAVTGYPKKFLKAICYDENDVECVVEATWEFDWDKVSIPNIENPYTLVDVVILE